MALHLVCDGDLSRHELNRELRQPPDPPSTLGGRWHTAGPGLSHKEAVTESGVPSPFPETLIELLTYLKK